MIGLVYFAVSVGMATGSWSAAALNGALFGFFAYLTYNATNLSTLKGYSAAVAVVDTTWGTALGAIVAGATVMILAALGVLRPDDQVDSALDARRLTPMIR